MISSFVLGPTTMAGKLGRIILMLRSMVRGVDLKWRFS